MSQKSIKSKVMTQISSGQIRMKPRWYFIAGSLLTSLGLIGLNVSAIFMLNLSLFLLRQHGPMGEWRLQLMLATFPWVIPGLAVVFLAIGIVMLKKFDFSYQKNFSLIVITILTTVIAAAIMIDLMGINDAWFGPGSHRRSIQPRQQYLRHFNN